MCCRSQLPGRFYELNIHYGVFVGGMGDFNEIFLGNQKNFRGCMEAVLFNGLDVMVTAEDKAAKAEDRAATAENIDSNDPKAKVQAAYASIVEEGRS